MQRTGNTQDDRRTNSISDMETKIENFVESSDLSLEDVTATAIRMLTMKKGPLSKLLRYCIDEAGDQFISEEFYHKYPELLDFLAITGCDNEEVLFKAWVNNHPDIFKCKTFECDGKIIGGCPKMYCESCEKAYFLQIEIITDIVCGRCAANNMGECTEKSRRTRHQIYTV